MAEIDASDYAAYVAASADDDDAIQSVIDSVLVAARRYCGWHVSPERADEEVTLNGPGGYRLFLKTKKLNEITSVIEDGVELEIGTDVVADPETPGMLVRKCGAWTREFASIVVTFTHGYTEEQAADWRRAVMKVSRLWLQTSKRDTADLKRKKIDDVEYEWFESVVSTNAELASAFSQFRLIPSP